MRETGDTGEMTGGEAGGQPETTTEAMLHRLSALGADSDRPRAVDDELATLVYDSGSVAPAAGGVRGGLGATRQLTFEAPDLLLEIQVEGRYRELTCQVVPPQPAALEIRHAGGSIDLGDDVFGTFYAPELPVGSVSIRCVPLSGGIAPTATSWVNL